jgi:hypothetical protein
MCQSVLPGLLSNKVLHNPQFFVVSRLKSAGIMKNITIMIGENKFVIDPVIATLCEESVGTERWRDTTNFHG